jgi:hypothetical protein
MSHYIPLLVETQQRGYIPLKKEHTWPRSTKIQLQTYGLPHIPVQPRFYLGGLWIDPFNRSWSFCPGVRLLAQFMSTFLILRKTERGRAEEQVNYNLGTQASERITCLKCGPLNHKSLDAIVDGTVLQCIGFPHFIRMIASSRPHLLPQRRSLALEARRG